MIDEALVQRLIAAQFPQYKELSIHSVERQGWDNRTFRLGESLLVRLPSGEKYSLSVKKEQEWLPRLAPFLPLSIPAPLLMGEPMDDYPWNWSIYRWIEGNPAIMAPIDSLSDIAMSLAQFLLNLQSIDTTDGPMAGEHSFYRGGTLANYDTPIRQAFAILKNKMDVETAVEIWEEALTTKWEAPPIWVHGDISPSNLLIKEKQLCAVIDFGQLAVGDPACDLTIAWTFFKGESRKIFKTLLNLDSATWARSRAWALWKFMVVTAGLTTWNAPEASQAERIIEEVLLEHKESRDYE